MIEEVREKRIKFFEITLALIIIILVVWLLTYEFFLREDEEEIVIDDDEIVETKTDEIDEKNLYDTYTTSDRKYYLRVVKTNDRKAYNDAKAKYNSINKNSKYRNTKAIYYGYLNDLIFEITDINEDVKYSLVKGRLIDNEKILYNFIINKETKMIEENPSRVNEDTTRFFDANNPRLYSIVKSDNKYFFKENVTKIISIMYTNEWNKLGYVNSDYTVNGDKIVAYTDQDLEEEVIYDLDGKIISEE